MKKLFVVGVVSLGLFASAEDQEIKQGLQLPVCLKTNALSPKRSQFQRLSDSALAQWAEIQALSQTVHEIIKKTGKKKISVSELPVRIKIKIKNLKQTHAQTLRKFSREVEALSADYEKLLSKNFGKVSKPKANSEKMDELYGLFEKSEGYRLDCAEELLEVHVFLYFKFQQILEPEWQPELNLEPLKIPDFEKPMKATR